MDKQKTKMTNEPLFEDFNEAVTKILTNSDINPAVEFIAAISKKSENQEDELRQKFFRFCVSKYPDTLSLKLIQIYTSKEPRVLNNIRESTMRFLFVIVIIEEASLNLATVQELSKRLISCLEEQEISETSFNILCGIVNRIASELFTVLEATWHEFREYISSRAKTEFERAVCVFKSLSMPLDGNEFVIPLMEKLLPRILIRLSGEEENLSHWCLAFVGGFCAAVHLLETTRVDLVKNLALEMVKSVKRGMELGFMGTALEEVEDIVKKQLWWYCTTELRFVSGLVKRIDAVITEKSTKIVLQRIQIAMEKKMLESVAVIDKSNEDWSFFD